MGRVNLRALIKLELMQQDLVLNTLNQNWTIFTKYGKKPAWPSFRGQANSSKEDFLTMSGDLTRSANIVTSIYLDPGNKDTIFPIPQLQWNLH